MGKENNNVISASVGLILVLIPDNSLEFSIWFPFFRYCKVIKSSFKIGNYISPK
jgi:hypothetical protein